MAALVHWLLRSWDLTFTELLLQKKTKESYSPWQFSTTFALPIAPSSLKPLGMFLTFLDDLWWPALPHTLLGPSRGTFIAVAYWVNICTQDFMCLSPISLLSCSLLFVPGFWQSVHLLRGFSCWTQPQLASSKAAELWSQLIILNFLFPLLR